MKSREWVQAFMNKLSDEVEAFEKELEALEAAAASGGGGKKKVAAGEKTPEEQLLLVMRNHRFHEEKLDALLVALEEGSVEPDAVDALKDDLDYYAEQAREPEFVADLNLYDDLALQGACGSGGWGALRWAALTPPPPRRGSRRGL